MITRCATVRFDLASHLNAGGAHSVGTDCGCVKWRSGADGSGDG